jgi:hypothetical protein
MIELHLRSVAIPSVDILEDMIMKAQLQQALTNAPVITTTNGTTPPVPPVATAPAPTLAQRIAAAATLAALLSMEAEARTSAEAGVWLIYLDAVSAMHAALVAEQVQAAANKAAADADAAKASMDALLQSSILQVIGKFAPMIASVPALLAQVQPALDAYRASRVGNTSIASIINAVANSPLPVVQSQAAPMPTNTPKVCVNQSYLQ